MCLDFLHLSWIQGFGRVVQPEFHACRCLRLGTYGLTIDGPIGHAWYKVLDKYVYPNDPQCNAAVLLKTAADQIAWAPIMTCVYFAFLRTLEGHPELIVSTIQVGSRSSFQTCAGLHLSRAPQLCMAAPVCC